MKILTIVVTLSGIIFIGGCASVPTGPSVMALPGTGKSFDQFRADDAECKQYAFSQTGSADQAATDAGIRSAAVGTVVGAAAGAAIGGHDSASAGAGTGLLVGSMAGAGAAQTSAHGTQRRYDHAYIQCMYAKGEQVPVSGPPVRQRQHAPYAAQPDPVGPYLQPPPSAPPPPPVGYPPPPPGR